MTKRPYTMTLRAEKAADTRRRILESAMTLYCEPPIEDFTLEDVASSAGATVQTVLRDFGNKENVIFEACTSWAAAA